MTRSDDDNAIGSPDASPKSRNDPRTGPIPLGSPDKCDEKTARAGVIPNEVAGISSHGSAWPFVRELIAIEKKLPYTPEPIKLERRCEELRKILWESYPKDAEKLGLSKLQARNLSQSAPVKAKAAGYGTGEEFVAAKSWQEIEVAFLSDNRVEICGGGSRKTCNYAELGFADGRNGKPKRAWVVLRELAQVGTIATAQISGEQLVKLQKRIEEIRKGLRSYFRIATDPIPFNGGSYQASFKLTRRPSFDT